MNSLMSARVDKVNPKIGARVIHRSVHTWRFNLVQYLEELKGDHGTKTKWSFCYYTLTVDKFVNLYNHLPYGLFCQKVIPHAPCILSLNIIQTLFIRRILHMSTLLLKRKDIPHAQLIKSYGKPLQIILRSCFNTYSAFFSLHTVYQLRKIEDWEEVLFILVILDCHRRKTFFNWTA